MDDMRTTPDREQPAGFVPAYVPAKGQAKGLKHDAGHTADAPDEPQAEVVGPIAAEDAEALLALKNLEKRRRDKKRKFRIKVAVAALAVVAVAGAAFALANQGQVADEDAMAPVVEYAHRQDFETVVNGSGALNPNDTVIVTPEVDGVVSAVYAKRGQEVQKGDKLFELRSPEVEKTLSEASEAVESAQADVNEAAAVVDQLYASQNQVAQAYNKALDQAAADQEQAAKAYDDAYDSAMSEASERLEDAQDEVDDASEDLADAQDELKQAKDKLARADEKGKAAAQAAVDSAKAGLTAAEEAYDAAQAALQAERKSYDAAEESARESAQRAHDAVEITEVPEYSDEGFDSEISQAQSAVNTAQKALDTANRTYAEAQELDAKRVVTAPKAGTLVAFDVVEGTSFGGERSSSEQTLVQIADVSKLRVSIEVNETDVNDVKAGQKARCTFVSIPDLELEGEVTSVASTASGSGEGSWEGGGVVTFGVEVLIDKPDPNLRLGMTAAIDIITQSVPDALVVPASAVVGDGDEAFVQVVVDEDTMQVEERAVTVGPKSASLAVVQKGLEEGEAVLVSDFGGLDDDESMIADA